MAHRKRSHDELVHDDAQVNSTSNGVSINHRRSNLMSETTEQALLEPSAGARPDRDDNANEWQTAESRSSKKRKKLPRKDRGNYPEISHSAHARLQSFVKLSDLQNLALYLLADGSGPQWCSVKHHSNVRKVVMLMVPGLEAGMFDNSISLQPADRRRAPAAALSDQPDGGTMPDSDPVTDKKVHANGPVDHASPKPKALISPDDYYPKRLKKMLLAEPLQPLADIFEHMWPIKTPGDDKYARMHSPLGSVLTVSMVKDKTKEDKYSKGPQTPNEAKKWQNRRTPITEYLASKEELMLEGYVLHPAYFDGDTEAYDRYRHNRNASHRDGSGNWVATPNIARLTDGLVAESQIEQGAVTAGRKILAIDCEMCITRPDPRQFSLTRMSVVDWSGDVVLDELIKPAEPITDYLTPYSGITAQMLEGVTTTLAEAQQKLLSKIDKHTILVGHSLNSDLAALEITHPFIVDTALLYPHPRGPPLKSSLKWLARKYLSREIQTGHGSTGHDSIEDARTSLDLVKQKCEKGKLWGTHEASGESIFNRLTRSVRPKRYKVQPDGQDEPRTGAVVDWGEPSRGFGSQAAIAIGCKTDADVVEGVKRALAYSEPDIGLSIPADGVDFVWARFRELEAFRGWWSGSKTQDVDDLRAAALQRYENNGLDTVVCNTVDHINQIWEVLPACTALIVYSGSGEPRTLADLQDRKQKHKAEYMTKKWDELTIRWTDVEEQQLRAACDTARRGIGFIAVK